MSLASIILISIAVFTSATVAFVLLRKHFREMPIEVTNTVTDQFIDAPIPYGVYLICGPQGVGKTSFMYALLSTDAKYHEKERLTAAAEESMVLKRSGFVGDDIDLRIPPCAYRTRSKVILPDGRETLHADISDFGLPGKFEGTHTFPTMTVIACEEIDSAMDNRKWNKDTDMKTAIFDGMKYIRHQNLVFLGDLQNIGKVDINIRRLATDVIYILKKKDFYEKPHWYSRKKQLVRTEWDFVWMNYQLAENIKTLKEMGMDIDQKYIRRCRFIYKGNIYSQYDSRSGKAYWFRKFKSFTMEKHPKNLFTPSGIEEYCRQNSLYLNDDGDEETNKD